MVLATPISPSARGVTRRRDAPRVSARECTRPVKRPVSAPGWSVTLKLPDATKRVRRLVGPLPGLTEIEIDNLDSGDWQP